jgi:hypothetical protein
VALLRERRWPRITAAYAVFVIVLATVTAFTREAVAEDHQGTVIRLAVALLVAVVLIHLRSHFRGDPLWDPPSNFADALARRVPTPKVDPGFVKLRGEIANALASRAYFDKVLWPRLHTLAGGRLPPLPRLRLARRGPSRATLAELIGSIEEKARR